MGGRILAVLLGAPLAIAAAALAQQVATPGRWAVVAGTVVALGAGAAALRPLADRARPDPVLAAGAVGLLAPAVATAWETGRLLGAGPVARLAWMLGEEDNAHVVGVARELLDTGPRGAELAAQYGTSFATPGVAALRSGLAGAATGDARLDAITATTAAAAVLPLLLGLALVLAAVAVRAARPADPATTAPRSIARRSGRAAAAFAAAALLGTAAQLTAVALPLQLGFATLAWALAWVVVGWAAVLGLEVALPPGASGGSGARVALVVQVVAAAVLLEGSWPFLAGALVLPVVVRMAAPALATVRRGIAGAGRAAVLRAAVAAVAVATAIGAVLAASGAFQTVLAFGRVAFTAGVEVGSSIIAVGPALRAAAAVAILAVVAVVGRAAGRTRLAVAVASAAAGAGVSLAVVQAAAVVVADGITGYGGSKLLLALVVLALAAGAAVVGTGARPVVGSAVGVLLVALILVDPLGRTAVGWWERTAPSEPPHAVATVAALESSSPDLPIRCRPAPGTPATTTARVAAYFCIVWMEDAFNAGPSSGNRFDFFTTEAATFDDAVRTAEADGLYGFALPLRLGPGWFGWDGVS